MRDQSIFIVFCFYTRVMCERSVHVYCVLFQYKGVCVRDQSILLCSVSIQE